MDVLRSELLRLWAMPDFDSAAYVRVHRQIARIIGAAHQRPTASTPCDLIGVERNETVGSDVVVSQ